MANNIYNFTVEDILKAAKEKENKEETAPKVSAQTATASTVSADSGKQQLLDSLAEIEKKYDVGGINYPETLGLDKITYDGPTDEEIKSLAEAELTQKKITGENSINTDTEKKREDLSEYKTNEEKSVAEQLKAIEKQYEERKTAAEKEALKRGLARSSIIMNRIEEFDKGKIDNEVQLRSDLSDKINKIDFSIASLETAREKALSDFDITLAAELTKKISELSAERKKNEDEALKYNNTVTEKESKYQAEKSDAEQKALENYLKNKDQYEKIVLDEKLDAVKAYYETMSPQDALNDFLRDSTMQRQLKEYYDYMLVYLKLKAAK